MTTTPPTQPLAPSRPRPRGRLRHALGRAELAEETIFTSTRQAAALNPAVVATHPALAGPITGVDLATGQPVTTDPHALYEQGRVTSPNVLVLGDISSGKSSLVKTQYCVRQVACGKQVVVLDRKNQQGRGEYERAAAECGATPVRFARTGGTAINLLDPRISTTSESGGDGRVGQDRLLLMVAEHAHERNLSPRQRYALRTAHRTALERARGDGRVATLHDVITALYDPADNAIPRPHLRTEGVVSRRDVIGWGLDLALDLERFVNGDLSGLIDRETSTDLDLDARLIVFDTSALPEDSPALSLVMALVATFLSAVWAQHPGRRLIVLEEGYHTARLEKVAGVLRSLAKRGRGIGLSFVTVVHHLSDIREDSDAMSLVREAGIVHVYRQSREDDAAQVLRQFRLPDTLNRQLAALAQGVHVLRIGHEPARMVQHLRTRLETAITDTDQAMTGRPRTTEAM
ncbi:type IV secretory system conjugative DNA transfer family protein [Streptomyces marincola]|uniref:type IV secretory system conjugative DNA transfer family protein n=1 Tax=Streptomyces marincola TaxID=2878388 RepID=UPI001CF55B9F|nr:type IV secretory system conjugative DNA transfer family protein [Streptomyces marincola]UCM87994.1 type IV secretory system conjugative DNA transfer family protein [Streptomyces marincola]